MIIKGFTAPGFSKASIMLNVKAGQISFLLLFKVHCFKLVALTLKVLSLGAVLPVRCFALPVLTLKLLFQISFLAFFKKLRPLFLWYIFFNSLAVSADSLKEKEIISSADASSSSFFRNVKDVNLFKKDSNYYIQQLTPRLNMIFSGEFIDISSSLSYYIRSINSEFSLLFHKNPYFRTGSILFSSPRHQISNAHVFFYTLPFVQIYASNNPNLMDLWSLFDWSEDTLIHELNHIYQFSQNRQWENFFFWPLFGLFDKSIVSIFLYRNKLMPTWMLEGDAVLSESLYGSGGRLWSGAARAFVFSQMKESRISLKRLLKPYKDPFSNLEKYLHGAFFFSYLKSQYGLKKIKDFFYESSRYLPLDYYGLNSSLKRAFDSDLKALFQGYKNYYQEKAGKQKFSAQPVLFKSKIFAPLNSDEGSLYFLISDLKSPAELVVWNKKDNTFKKRKAYLPVGKVFYRNGKYVSPGNTKVNSVSIEYTLIKEGFKPVSKYNSQYVMDFYGDQALFVDMQKSHTHNALHLGDAFYDSIHSSALADSEGSVYYFKQNGENRTLYKNKKPLIEFRSYYAYPVELNPTSVYFIGPTPYGSSLFVYRVNEGIYRLNSSDRIVSARHIKEDKFLAIEIGSNHYEYKIISVKPTSEQPFFYNDLFKKRSLFQKLSFESGVASKKPDVASKKPGVVSKKSGVASKKPGVASKKVDVASKKVDVASKKPGVASKKVDVSSEGIKPYSPFSNLFLTDINFSFFKYFYGSIDFKDPLNFNSVSLSVFASNNIKSFNLLYSYKKYRPSFEIFLNYTTGLLNANKDSGLLDTFQDLGFLDEKDRYTVKRDLKQESFNKETDLTLGFQAVRILKERRAFFLYQRASAGLGVSYPIYRYSESSLKASSYIFLEQRRFLDHPWVRYIQNKGKIHYRFIRKYPYAYSYYKKRDLSAEYNLLFLKDNNLHLSGSINGDFVEELGQELFLNIQSRALWGLWNRKRISLPINFTANFHYNFLEESIQNLYELDLLLFKVFNRSFYSLKIPFSLIRFAPLTGVSFLFFKNYTEANRFLLIPFIGWEGEFALGSDKNIFKAGFAVQKPLGLFKKDSSFAGASTDSHLPLELLEDNNFSKIQFASWFTLSL